MLLDMAPCYSRERNIGNMNVLKGSNRSLKNVILSKQILCPRSSETQPQKIETQQLLGPIPFKGGPSSVPDDLYTSLV
jgi:hypothetical protein